MHTAHFPKSARILKADEFAAMVRLRPWARTPHFVLYGRYTGDLSRLGLVTGRKHARRAVTRNTIRRIGRELFRSRRAEFAGWDVVVRLQQRVERKDLPSASSPKLKAMCWDEMRTLFALALKRMARSADSNRSVDTL